MSCSWVKKIMLLALVGVGSIEAVAEPDLPLHCQHLQLRPADTNFPNMYAFAVDEAYRHPERPFAILSVEVWDEGLGTLRVAYESSIQDNDKRFRGEGRIRTTEWEPLFDQKKWRTFTFYLDHIAFNRQVPALNEADLRIESRSPFKIRSVRLDHPTASQLQQYFLLEDYPVGQRNENGRSLTRDEKILKRPQ